jgi:hypothetical protein
VSRTDTLGPAPAAAPVPPPRRTSRSVVYVGLASGVVLVLLVAAVVSWAVRDRAGTSTAGTDAATNVPASWARPAVDADGLADRSGVTLTRVAITGGGGLVDLRFRVVDPNKADALHDTSKPPALVDEASGLVVKNLLMDHAHTGPFKAGVTYYLVFENPGNWLHSGSKVTVLLGDAQVEHVVVR